MVNMKVSVSTKLPAMLISQSIQRAPVKASREKNTIQYMVTRMNAYVANFVVPNVLKPGMRSALSSSLR